jgi:hypothetical protein
VSSAYLFGSVERERGAHEVDGLLIAEHIPESIAGEQDELVVRREEVLEDVWLRRHQILPIMRREEKRREENATTQRRTHQG